MLLSSVFCYGPGPSFCYLETFSILNPHRDLCFPEVSAYKPPEPRGKVSACERKLDKRLPGASAAGVGKGVDGKLWQLPQRCLRRTPLEELINNTVWFRASVKNDNSS